jgi:DinB superfamily
MTNPPERYSDLTGDDDPAVSQLINRLDSGLRSQPAPPEVHAALDQALRERIEASRKLAILSRRAALKAGAAGIAALLTLSHTTPAIAAELAHLAGESPMTGPRLAGILRTERIRWNALLAQVGADRMEVPGIEGEWSVKQLVAHLTWYEQAIVDGARQVVTTGTFTRPRDRGPYAGLSMDELNDRIAAESRERPLTDVLTEADRVFDQLTRLIEAVPQDLLNDPHILGLPDDLLPWMGVANNSYSHYRQHEDSLRAWLDRQARPTGEGQEDRDAKQ